MNDLDVNKLLKEATFNFSRSGGKGGQNVNKVETKVELLFDISNSFLINDEIREKLLKKLSGKVDNSEVLHITSQTERTQLGNRKKVIEKFSRMIQNALIKENIRIRTAEPYSSKVRRLETKRKHAEKKKVRSVRDFLDE